MLGTTCLAAPAAHPFISDTVGTQELLRQLDAVQASGNTILAVILIEALYRRLDAATC